MEDSMSNKKTWLFAVTHGELEDMGFAPEVFEHLNEPVGLRLTASDVRRGLDEPRMKDGNVDPVGSDDAMSVIKRLQSEAASVRIDLRVVSEAGQKALERVDELTVIYNKQFDEITRLKEDIVEWQEKYVQRDDQFSAAEESNLKLKEKIEDWKEKFGNTEKQLETVKERNEKLTRQNKSYFQGAQNEVEISREESNAARELYDNKKSQYAILKGQYDDIKGRHDELEETVKTEQERVYNLRIIRSQFENRYGVYDWDKINLPLAWYQKIVAWFWRI